MAKRSVRVKSSITGHQALMFLVAVFLGALGFASLVQGLLMQWSFGFKYGFFSYLLSFIFLGSAKLVKLKLLKEL
ncbi:hypothetical protein D6777_00895 [Candidatus Woesearchaeota archaeon]|nr:MAG: hypothetical protein D6777_00895 [Candidatus Woesearchaeota archaeon]